MQSDYTTYKKDGKYFIGVYAIAGQVFECSKKREERGQAVKDAAEARREKMPKKAQADTKKEPAKKPLTRKTKPAKASKTAPVSAAA